MNLNELRKGNIVEIPIFCEIVKIKEIHEDTVILDMTGADFDGLEYRAKAEHIKPVKFDAKMVEKCGFDVEGSEAGDDGAYQLGCGPMEKELCFLWIPKKGEYMDKDSIGLWLSQDYNNQTLKIDIKRVKYLHQFQNLYFDLTNKELKIKL